MNKLLAYFMVFTIFSPNTLGDSTTRNLPAVVLKSSSGKENYETFRK